MAEFGRVVPKLHHGALSVNNFTGVIETNHFVNQTSDMLYVRNRQGLLLPIEPKRATLTTQGDTSGLILSKSWQVNGSKAGEAFFNSLMHDNTISDDIRKIARGGGLTRVANGYLFTVNYMLSAEEIKSFDNVYVDGFDFLLADSHHALGEHPYNSTSKMALIEAERHSGMFMSSIRIKCSSEKNAVFWLACPNGAFSITAAYEPWWDKDVVDVAYQRSNDSEPVREVYSLEDALKGKLKLFRTREEALHFLNGDTNKAELIKAESELKQLKIEHAARDAELTNARARLEHDAKLETLALERKNMQQKGVVETLKLVPIVGTIFGMISSLVALFF